ncbi:hypothetical protein FHW96_000247 [Novosphingobium sp. SG751A]|uniref:phage holin family protein n=1 Tax=Novosphingobium sp. SG751A TaxID=2587000 RepID=UPI001551A1A9|nr:phage holin family protein [Novosphingobium sp. SG751A]NOW44120.1 hypothetical protein [Novosphingobium sp. SG751A]
MAEIPQIPAEYVWTGAGGVLGRLMFHAREVQRGRRKPWSGALLYDVPIALGMGWSAYGACVWAHLAIQPSVTAAILASYLGPYTLDRMIGRVADRYLGGKSA